MKKRRARLEIVMSVLSALESEEMPPTQLATAVNMPYDRLKRLLDELEARGLVGSKESGRSKAYYLTEKGLHVLSELRRIRRILEEYGLL